MRSRERDDVYLGGGKLRGTAYVDGSLQIYEKVTAAANT